jgi:hypothetical protein
MPITTASASGPQITPEDARELMSARERMLARHKLIEGMIGNNELQLKNESARGGAEIERECARRAAAAPEAGPEAQAAIADIDARLRMLEDQRQRLVSEREWLNAALLDFENDPSARPSQRGALS